MSQGVLLVVDDNKMNRDMLSRRLIREGFSVLTAESGQQAIDMVRAHALDLVLMDLMMPDMTGTEAIAILRQTYSALQLPIIMVSANTDSEEMVKAITNGANDYVTKPIDFPVTLAKIKSYLARRSAAPPAAPAAAANGPAPDSQRTVSMRPADLKLGDVINQYRLESLLGEGGMGKVYRATDVRLLREVAIKVVLGESVEDSQLDRFLQEARSLARVQHPGVITIYSIEEHPLHYIAMELVEGQELEHVLNSGKPIPTDQAREWTVQILDALQAVHDKGILHRDLKPSNVMIDSTSRVRVMDFGLAKIVEEDLKLTKSGEVWGTPQYMAPEHVDPAFGELDNQTDLYATGVILYQMLTGALPIKAKSLPQILFELVSKQPDPPERLNPAIPAELSHVVLKSLEKDKSKRYRCARDFANDLRAVVLPR